MIKLENNAGEMKIELKGNANDLAVEFTHVCVEVIEQISERLEEAGVTPEEQGELKLLSHLVTCFACKKAGVLNFIDTLVLGKSGYVEAKHKKTVEYIQDLIEDTKAAKNAMPEEEKAKKVFEALFGIELDGLDIDIDIEVTECDKQEQPDRPTAVWMHTGINGEWECSNCKSQVALSDDVHGHPRFCSICGYEMIASVEPEGEADGEE